MAPEFWTPEILEILDPAGLHIECFTCALDWLKNARGLGWPGASDMSNNENPPDPAELRWWPTLQMDTVFGGRLNSQEK